MTSRDKTLHKALMYFISYLINVFVEEYVLTTSLADELNLVSVRSIVGAAF